MKRTRNKIVRTNYIPASPDSNSKKIIKLLEQMAVANCNKDRKLFKTLDHQLHNAQKLQIKLQNK